MAGAYGVENLKQLLDFGFAAGKALDGALADGHLKLEDVVHFIPVLALVGPAMDDLSKAPKEFSELDAADVAALVSHGKAKLAGVDDARLKEVVGASLNVALHVGKLISVLRKDQAPKPVPAPAKP